MDTFVGVFHSFAWKVGRVLSFDKQFFFHVNLTKEFCFRKHATAMVKDQSLRDRDRSLCPKRGSLKYQRAG